MKNCTLTFLLVIGMSFGATAQVAQDPVLPVSRKVVKFYPNPATSLINFEFLKAPQPGTTFQVYNFLGKKVLEMHRFPVKAQVDLSNFTRGLYIFQLKDPSGRVLESGKFQVEK